MDCGLCDIPLTKEGRCSNCGATPGINPNAQQSLIDLANMFCSGNDQHVNRRSKRLKFDNRSNCNGRPISHVQATKRRAVLHNIFSNLEVGCVDREKPNNSDISNNPMSAGTPDSNSVEMTEMVETVTSESDDEESFIRVSSDVEKYFDIEAVDGEKSSLVNCPSDLDEQENDLCSKVERDEVTEDSFNVVEICFNCQRQNDERFAHLDSYEILRFRVVNLKDFNRSTRRKFCNFKLSNYSLREREGKVLCDNCYCYLTAEDAEKTSDSFKWPSFVWKVLLNRTIYRKAWRLLIPKWRFWWLQSVSVFQQVEENQLQKMHCKFVDVTEDMNKDLLALERLRWTKDIVPRELSLTLPIVKCPAGCSEWKHKAESLPFDIVWEELLDTDLNLYSSEKYRSVGNIFREDYLIPTPILHNKKWMCKASYAGTEQGLPVVLCCRYHNKNTKGKLIHPPRNPVGSIASEQTCQFSPVIPIPRTIAKAKKSKFSCSFHMAAMQGCYYGLDTMYLSTERKNCNDQTPQAWKQEVLAINNRDDLYNMFYEDFRTRRIGVNLFNAAKKDMKRFFPDWEQQKPKYLFGSTFVKQSDAINMHKSLEFNGLETLLKMNKQGKVLQQTFAVPWPRHIPWIHPTLSKSGATFPPTLSLAKIKKKDTRLMWILCSMVAYIPEIWYAVSISQKRLWEWEGYILTVGNEYSFPHIRIKGQTKNPFKGRKLQDIYSQYINKTQSSIFDVEEIQDLFERDYPEENYTNIHFSRNKFQVPSQPNKKVNIVLFGMKSTKESFWFPTENIETEDTTIWELRYLAITASSETNDASQYSSTAYCRHGGILHPNWWKIDRFTRRAQDLGDEWTIANIPLQDVANWNVCIYIKRGVTLDYSSLKEQLLVSCGGQVKTYCHLHKVPLILTAGHINMQCSCPNLDTPVVTIGEYMDIKDSCMNTARLSCPVQNCQAGICKHHDDQIIQTSRKFLVHPSDVTKCRYDNAVTISIPRTNNLQRLTRLRNFSQDPPGNTSFIDLSTTTTDKSSSFMSENTYQQKVFISSDTESNSSSTSCSDNSFNESEDDMSFDNISHSSVETSDGNYNFVDFDMFRCGDNEWFFESDMNNDDVPNEENDGHFMTCPPDGMDDFEEFDAQSNYSTLSEDTGDGSVFVPTTCAGLDPIFTATTTEPYKSHTISNHCLLNFYGHCLIRRNKRLQGTKRQRNFLQRLVAVNENSCIPLIYPESLLFTDCFYVNEQDGSTIGALPAALLNSNRVLSNFGFGSLQDHFRSRLSNHGLLCSANPKYHLFSFDAISNLGMRGTDSRIILRRGFAESQGTGGVKIRSKDDPIFDTEQVDCRPVVNKLASAVGEKYPTYFYTHTCSMKTHFGLKLIWEWISSDELLKLLSTESETEQDMKFLQKSIIDSSGVLLLRCWMEILHIWILYITKSPDRPLGRITRFFFRFELQEATANLPHLHSLLWTDDNLQTNEGLATALDRIRGTVDDIIRPDERDKYFREGVFQSHEDMLDFQDQMDSFLRHKHDRRCKVYKQQENGTQQETLVCKVPDRWIISSSPSEHTFIELPIEHSQEAIRVMQKLEVAAMPDENEPKKSLLVFEPLFEFLKNQKHVAPSTKNQGLISPVCGPLVAINPNSDNLQHCTGFTVLRYIIKYITTIDLYNQMRIGGPKFNKEKTICQVEGEMLRNTKITSNKIAQEQKNSKEKRTQGQHPARGINVTETYMYMFGYAPVITNIKFVKVPSQQYDERGACERKKPIERLIKGNQKLKQKTLQSQALTAIDIIPVHAAYTSMQLQVYRQFLPSQIRRAKDDLYSPLSTDFITRFGFRPPILRCIMQVKKYARWFVIEKNHGEMDDVMAYVKENTHKIDLGQSTWFDAESSIIKVRASALHEILEYTRDLPNAWFGGIHQKTLIINLFKNIYQAYRYFKFGELPCQTHRRRKVHLDNQKKKFLDLKNRFIAKFEDDDLPVPWHNSIRPTQTVKFLIHILLTMGYFVDEYELFSVPNIRESFIRAHLLDPNNPEESTQKLMKNYFFEQLKILPAGTSTFDRCCVVAYRTFQDLFVNNTIYCDEMPTVMYCQLQRQTDQQIMSYRLTKQDNLIKNIHTKLEKAGIHPLPDLDSCLSTSLLAPTVWDLSTIQRSDRQPEASVHEQSHVLEKAIHLIDRYSQPRNECTQNLCIIGAGGVGKTTTMMMLLLYARTKLLTVGITSFVSERAQELAGDHVNFMFGIVACEKLTVGQMAERAISQLYRKPDKMHLLQTLDILGLDELGSMSAEYVCIIDIILRYVRESNKPFGGLLLICTLDHLQIDPCSGKHPLLCPLFISSFKFYKLTESVRAAQDFEWQRIQEITRLSHDELCIPEIKEEFISLIVKCCSFMMVDSDTNCPRNALYVFGKNAPIRDEEKKLFAKLKEKNDTEYIISEAKDEERSVDGRFHIASETISKSLNKKTKEPNILYFFKGARFQITFNKPGSFSNSQLAILTELPNRDDIKERKPINLLVAPPGCRYIPTETDLISDLQASGWEYMNVGSPPERTYDVGSGVRARRFQYGLRHHIGTTIHSVMGQTLSALVTRVALAKSSKYSLWLAAQAVVLLSRTEKAKDTYFITKDKNKTANVLYQILLKTSPMRGYLNALIESLCTNTIMDVQRTVEIQHRHSIFRVKDIPLPRDQTGAAYILISLKNNLYTYIGSTSCLIERLKQHNSGFGSKQTSPEHLRPWALMAYVVGFEGRKDLYRDFENQWIQNKIEYMNSSHCQHNVEDIMNIGRDMIEFFRDGIYSLKFVNCGALEYLT